MAKYIRTPVINFDDLPEKEQEHFEGHEGYQFVQDPLDPEHYLSMGDFSIATGSKLWDGIYGQSYFSAYFIKLGGNENSGMATVGYRHW